MSERQGVASNAASADWSANTVHPACEHCGAPVDERQRYCVVCGARRSDAANPAIRYFAAAAQHERRVRLIDQPREDRRADGPKVAAALVLAILPLAVGIGVLLGRGANSGVDPKLLAALRAQPVQVVASGPTGPASAATAASTTATKPAGGSVLARTSFGAAHQISGFKPSATQVRRDSQVVQGINHKIGKSYVDAQRNLPDAIVVGGGGGGSAGPSHGPGQP